VVLRLLAILFFSAALLVGFGLGGERELDPLISAVNKDAVLALQAGVPSVLWDTRLRPLLSLPAWVASLVVGVVFLLAAAPRPGTG
jgi:hypothetical protein